jgi:hypothetical protein
MAELKKHLEGMPAEARKQMEQMMGSQPGAGGGGKADRVEVKKSPGTKAIGGFSCTRYELTQEGKELGSVWTTTKVPGVSGMQKDLKEFGERMASQMTANGPQMAQAMRAVEGFPMETSIGGMTATVTKVAEAAVAKSDFDVPAGFKKVPFAGRERRRRGDPMDEETNDEE